MLHAPYDLMRSLLCILAVYAAAVKGILSSVSWAQKKQKKFSKSG